LTDFGKIMPDAGYSIEIGLTVLNDDLTYCDEETKRFVGESINYDTCIGNSSDRSTATAISAGLLRRASYGRGDCWVGNTTFDLNENSSGELRILVKKANKLWILLISDNLRMRMSLKIPHL
jgi:hypothetical protein